MKRLKVMPALCMDLDGTVRRNKNDHEGFINHVSEIELRPGIKEILHKYRNTGYLICALSNQGGVAHGYKTEGQVYNELHATNTLTGDVFHLIMCCYAMEDGKVFPYNVKSLMRKPYIGMLAIFEQEAYESGIIIDWNKSIMVGDREEDKWCAKNADIHFFHIDNFLKLSHPLII